MKEYEISINEKKVGKIKLFIDNLKKNIKNSLIRKNEDKSFKVVNYKDDIQTYEITLKINNDDELYDIVSKYTYNNEIFKNIEDIKKYNNIKNIKNDTLIKIILPEIYLNNLGLSKDNLNKESVLNSKLYFVKKVIEETEKKDLISKYNILLNNYNSFKNSNEYQFYTDTEIENNIIKYIKEIDEIISFLENTTLYRYKKDFIKPIKIN